MATRADDAARGTSGSDVDEVFDAVRYEKSVPDGIEAHYWHLARNRVLSRAVAALPGAAEAPLVDVGCGRGVVVQALRRRGLDAWGCELGRPAPIGPDVAPFLHLGVASSELPEALRRDARTVLLCDVLEHLADPVGFLRDQLRDFPACRWVVVTLPARQELFSNYDTFYGHHLRYDRASLAALCGPSGLVLRRARYFFHGLYAPALALHRLGVARSVEIHAPAGAMVAVHRIVGALLAAESRFLPGALPGTSILGVLERR
jgi:hypothetical protein